MAVNKPYGDNARKGAVRERSQVLILKQTFMLSVMLTQDNLWM